MMRLWLGDLVLGREFACGNFTLTKDEIVAFAERFDPQPWHLDEMQAQASYFAGLCASGLHTQAAAIGLVVRAIADVAVIAGGALQEARFFIPARPGQQYQVTACWDGARVSARNPQRGVASIAIAARDDAGQPVMQCGITYIVAVKPGTN